MLYLSGVLQRLGRYHALEKISDRRVKSFVNAPPFRCRAFFEQTEYEAEILEITPDAKGNKYAFVRFAGYGNEETVWLDDIVASHGDEVWKKQVKDGSAAEEVEENQAAAAAADEVEEQLAAAMAAKAALTPENKEKEPETEKIQVQPKTNTNAVQVEIQSTQIQQLEQKVNAMNITLYKEKIQVITYQD